VKYAPIMPAGTEHLGPSTGYYLPIANNVLANATCREYFKKRSQDSVLIMDTLVYETGTPQLSLKQVEEAVDAINPAIVIAPDVLNDLPSTLDLFMGTVNGPIGAKIGVRRIMGAPQAKDFQGLMLCAEEMACDNIGYLGLGRKTFANANVSRVEFVAELTNRGFFEDYPYIKVHLLGASNDWSDEFALKDHPFVMGVDSAQAVHVALKGLSIDDPQAPECKRPDDFFQTPEPVVRECKELIWSNIQMVRSWLGD
jgi:hypothetical protein